MEKISPFDIRVYEPGSPEYRQLEAVAGIMNDCCPSKFWGSGFRVENIWFDYGAQLMRTTITYTIKKNGESVQALMPNEQAELMNAGTVRSLVEKVGQYFADRISRGYTE